MALAFLRRHQGVFLIRVLLGVVILGFVIFYVPMFWNSDSRAAGDEVGRVGDIPITVREFQRAFARQRAQYERLYRGKLDAAMLRALGLQDQVFEALVEQRVIELEAKRRGIVVSDGDLATAVAEMPSLQENGRFVGAARLQRLLEAQGQSLEDFEESLRDDLLRRRLESLLTDGVGLSLSEVEQQYRRRNDGMKAEYVLVPSAAFRGGVTVTEGEIRDQFAANKERYRVPEQRIADYVLVDPQAFRSQAAVTEGEVDTYFRKHSDEFKEQEEVCAHHLLIKVKSETNPQGHPAEEAEKLAHGLVEKLRAGADFAALAKAHSEDTGSSASGGDLGCFPRGTMVNEFENVAFNLPVGEISEPVRTQYGYHIIRVDKRKDEKQKPLAEVHDQIRADLLGRKAQVLGDAKSAALTDQLLRGKTLAEAARVAGLTLQASGPLRRGEARDPFDVAAVSRIFELAPGQANPYGLPSRSGQVFVSLREVQPAHTPKLEEAKAQIGVDLLDEKSLALAKARAVELRAKAGSMGLEKAASALGLSRKETPSFVGRGQPMGELGTGLALDEAFSLPAGTLSDPIRVSSGYAVLRVLEKKAFDPAAFERDKAAFAASLLDARRTQMLQAYLAQARLRFTVQRHAEELQRLAG